MNNRKIAGKCIMTLGILLVFASATLFLYNVYLENTAKNLSSQVLAVMNTEDPRINEGILPDYIVNPEMDMPVKNINDKYFAGVISISATDTELPVLSECNKDNLKEFPCIYNGTPYKNNLIIAGHDYRTHFGPISNLVRGDVVSFKDIDGNVFEYEVVYSEIIDEKDTELMHNGEWDLTLFTCTYSGKERITVRCRLITNP